MFPGVEQFGVGIQQRPDRRQKQQAAAMQFIPQACQACTEQPPGLLAGVLTDEQDLPEGQRYVLFGQRGSLVEQGFAAGQAQARQCRLDAFCRGAEAVARLIGLAQHLQGKGVSPLSPRRFHAS